MCGSSNAEILHTYLCALNFNIHKRNNQTVCQFDRHTTKLNILLILDYCLKKKVLS